MAYKNLPSPLSPMQRRSDFHPAPLKMRLQGLNVAPAEITMFSWA